MSAQIGIITNPYAGKNKPGGSKGAFLRKLVGEWGIVKETRNLEHLKDALAELVDLKVEYLVCDGGDGTVHWAINSFYEVASENQKKNFTDSLPVVVPTNGGTIDFLAAKAAITGGTESIVKALLEKLQKQENPVVIKLPTFIFRAHDIEKDKSVEKLGFSAALAGVGLIQLLRNEGYTVKPLSL